MTHGEKLSDGWIDLGFPPVHSRPRVSLGSRPGNPSSRNPWPKVRRTPTPSWSLAGFQCELPAKIPKDVENPWTSRIFVGSSSKGTMVFSTSLRLHPIGIYWGAKNWIHYNPLRPKQIAWHGQGVWQPEDQLHLQFQVDDLETWKNLKGILAKVRMSQE